MTCTLPRPGSYVTTRAGSQPILVVRDEQHQLRAFRNVCRHRGSRLLSGSGQCKAAIRCRYHGWTYRLDGSLIGVPEGMSFAQSIDKAAFGLMPVRVEEMCGLVFVNCDPDATPLADLVGDLPECLGSQLFGSWDVVLRYDLSQGLRVFAGSDADRLRLMTAKVGERIGEPKSWPRDPDDVLALVNDGAPERGGGGGHDIAPWRSCSRMVVGWAIRPGIEKAPWCSGQTISPRALIKPNFSGPPRWGQRLAMR